MADAPIRIEREGLLARVTLDRPEVHNAFDAATILALSAAFEELSSDATVRVILLAGAGKSFSAGGDLNWMRETGDYTTEQNVADAKVLARMLQVVDRTPKPVVCRVHGFALGGGTGLLSACDLVLAEEGATLGFSEVRLGLLPAVISPFVVRRIGAARARALMLTGARFPARRALEIGLCDEVHSSEALDQAVADHVKGLLKGGPVAQAAIKQLVRGVVGRAPEEVADLTARMIAEARASAEGHEGVSAFLEKRAPAWRS